MTRKIFFQTILSAFTFGTILPGWLTRSRNEISCVIPDQPDFECMSNLKAPPQSTFLVDLDEAKRTGLIHPHEIKFEISVDPGVATGDESVDTWFEVLDDLRTEVILSKRYQRPAPFTILDDPPRAFVIPNPEIS